MFATAHVLEIDTECAMFDDNEVVVFDENNSSSNVRIGFEVGSSVKVFTTRITLGEFSTIWIEDFAIEYKSTFSFVRKMFEKFGIASVTNTAINKDTNSFPRTNS